MSELQSNLNAEMEEQEICGKQITFLESSVNRISCKETMKDENESIGQVHPEHLYSMICSLEKENKQAEANIKTITQKINQAHKNILEKEQWCAQEQKHIEELSKELIIAQKELATAENKRDALMRVCARLSTEKQALKTKILLECSNVVTLCTHRSQRSNDSNNAGDNSNTVTNVQCNVNVENVQKWQQVHESLYHKLMCFKQELSSIQQEQEVSAIYKECHVEQCKTEEIEEEQRREHEDLEIICEHKLLKCVESSEYHSHELHLEQEQQEKQEQWEELEQCCSKECDECNRHVGAKPRKQITFDSGSLEKMIFVSAYNVNREGQNRNNNNNNNNNNKHISTMESKRMMESDKLDASCAAHSTNNEEEEEYEEFASTPEVKRTCDAAYCTETINEHATPHIVVTHSNTIEERKADVKSRNFAINIRDNNTFGRETFTRNNHVKPRRTVWKTASASFDKNNHAHDK